METIQAQTIKTPVSAAIWTGRILTGLVTLFFLMDAVMKIFRADVSVDGTIQLGFSDAVVIPLGVTLLCITILYVIPRTAVLGAILATAYLGGATATMVHERMSIIFPIAFGVITWAGLYLRSEKLRQLLPIQK